MTQNLTTTQNLSISVNDRACSISSASSIADLVKQLKQDGDVNSESGIALARNGTVVPKANWSSTVLKENDQIIIIVPTQGG